MRLSWIWRLKERSPSLCKSGVTIWLKPLVVAKEELEIAKLANTTKPTAAELSIFGRNYMGAFLIGLRRAPTFALTHIAPPAIPRRSVRLLERFSDSTSL